MQEVKQGVVECGSQVRQKTRQERKKSGTIITVSVKNQKTD